MNADRILKLSNLALTAVALSLVVAIYLEGRSAAQQPVLQEQQHDHCESEGHLNQRDPVRDPEPPQSKNPSPQGSGRVLDRSPGLRADDLVASDGAPQLVEYPHD